MRGIILQLCVIALISWSDCCAGVYEDFLSARETHDYSNVAVSLEGYANDGSVAAAILLGIAQYEGSGLPTGENTAAYRSLQAATQSPDAAFLAGIIAYEGRGSPRDYGMALKYFRSAADAGDADAQALMSWMYYQGLGINSDYQEALRWNQAAIRSGLADLPHLADTTEDVVASSSSRPKLRQLDWAGSCSQLGGLQNAGTVVFSYPSASDFRPKVTMFQQSIELVSPSGNVIAIAIKPGPFSVELSLPFKSQMWFDPTVISGVIRAGEVRAFVVSIITENAGKWDLYYRAIGSEIPAERFALAGPRLFSFDFDSLSQLRFRSPETAAAFESYFARRITERLNQIETASLDRLRSEVAEIDATRKRKADEAAQLARQGDGSPDDLACKARKLRPATAEYVRCRESLVAKREKQAAAEQRRQRDATHKAQQDEVSGSAGVDGDHLSLEAAKRKCAELGFKTGTESFGRCVLQLSR